MQHRLEISPFLSFFVSGFFFVENREWDEVAEEPRAEKFVDREMHFMIHEDTKNVSSDSG